MKKLLPFFAFVFLISCSEEEPSLTESFFKIYDDSNADISYHPIDVVETTEGYLVLSATELSSTDFNGVELLRIDKEGNFKEAQELNDYVVPVGDLYLNPADSNSYFFAMNPTSLNAVLIGVNPQLQIEVEETIGGINYPLASATTSSGNLLLLSYDPVSLETEISEISLDGSYIGGNSYSIGPGSDVEVEIINHYLNANDRPLPFFCGEFSPGNYYFNGFYNYSFSLVFTDFSDNPSGVVQGQSSNAGIRSALPLSGSNFAIAGYQFGDNYQLASSTLSTNGITSSVDFYPGNMAEIKSYSSAKIVSYISSKEYTVFASETKGRQILLNFYDSSDGTISGIDRVGYLNPFSLSSIKVTDDNSILVLGTTFVAGRFERIVLSKISEREISSITN